MDEDRPPYTPLRALLIIGAIALITAVVIVAVTEHPEAPSAADAEASAAVEASARPRPVTSLQPRPDPPPARAEPLPIEPPEEDIWAMIPDEHRLRELQEREFEQLGGISTPGTDPEGARGEVSEPGWAERTVRELRRGLRERVLAERTEIDRVECDRGRCLIELRYGSMADALGRIEALRAFLGQHVRCRAHTEGPDDTESPSVSPSQQIWILCGEPEER